MATRQKRSNAERLTHPLLEKFAEVPVPPQGLFAYAVKIVCGKQTETNCCCVAGTRPGLYATEVNIQNLNLERALVLKFVQARSPNHSFPGDFFRRADRKSVV